MTIEGQNNFKTFQPIDVDYASLPILQTSWHDLASVIRLEKMCFSKDDAWPFLDHLAVLTLPGIFRKKFELEGEVIAFLAAEKQEERKTAWITTIGVAPLHQHHGLARRLLADCEAGIGLPVVRLSVRRSNLGAIALYRKAGYGQVDVWPRYYIGGEDALVFEKRFD